MNSKTTQRRGKRTSPAPCSASCEKCGGVDIYRRGYRVAQAMTADGLQAVVNNLLSAGFEPVGGVSVTLIGTMHEEPIVLHTQALFYTSNTPGQVCGPAERTKS